MEQNYAAITKERVLRRINSEAPFFANCGVSCGQPFLASLNLS